MEENNTTPTSQASENIFEDFLDAKEKKEIQINNNQNQEKKRTKFDYFRYTVMWMYVFNTILFVCIVVFTLYVFVQNNDKKINLNFAQSFCWVFLGSKEILGNSCTWVTPTLKEFQWKIEELKSSQSNAILPVLRDYYNFENFKYSERVTFLLQNSFKRLEPSAILNSFDAIKRDFTGVDTGNVECYNISISSTALVSLECDIFSSDWDTSIIDVKENSKEILTWGGTSISRANSFIHFIENNEKKNFKIVEKPEEYTTQTVENWPYTKVTKIKLSLQYIDTDSLSF